MGDDECRSSLSNFALSEIIVTSRSVLLIVEFPKEVKHEFKVVYYTVGCKKTFGKYSHSIFLLAFEKSTVTLLNLQEEYLPLFTAHFTTLLPSIISFWSWSQSSKSSHPQSTLQLEFKCESETMLLLKISSPCKKPARSDSSITEIEVLLGFLLLLYFIKLCRRRNSMRSKQSRIKVIATMKCLLQEFEYRLKLIEESSCVSEFITSPTFF